MDQKVVKKEKELLEKYVNIMKKLMCQDVDPTKEFLKFSCGNYNSKEPEFSEIIPSMCDDICEIIINNKNISYSSFVKARNFYTSYKQDLKDFIKSDELSAICDGWPVFNNNWKDTNFNIAKITGILSATGFDTLFNTNIEYSGDETIVTVSPEHYRCELEAGKDKCIEKLLKLLEVPDKNIETIIKEMRSLMKKLDEIRPDEDNEAILKRHSIEELRKRSEFDYETFFTALLGRSINEKDIFEFKCYSSDHLEKFLNVLINVDKKTLANYILIQVGIPYTYYKVRKMDFFYPALIAAGFSTYFNENDEKKHNDVYNKISEILKDIPEKLKPNAENILQSIFNYEKSVLEYKNEHFSQENVDKEYKDLEISADNIFQNLINIGKFGPTQSLKKCAFSGNFREKLVIMKMKDFLDLAVRTHDKPILCHFVKYGYELLLKVLKNKIEGDDYKALKDSIKAQINEHKIRCVDDEDRDFIVEGSINVLEGLELIFKCYNNWLSENVELVKEQSKIFEKVGLNNKQAFFMAFAQKDCTQNFGELQMEFLCYLNCKDLIKEFKGFKK